MSTRLAEEIRLLHKAETAYQIPAALIIRRLIEDEARPLPDVLPRKPPWMDFEWPASGTVNLAEYWKAMDRNRPQGWRGEYL